MEGIKSFLRKHWAVIVFVLTALIDQSQGFLESLFTEQWIIVLIRIVGSLILAYKWVPVNSKLNVSASGGAVRPSKPR